MHMPSYDYTVMHKYKITIENQPNQEGTDVYFEDALGDGIAFNFDSEEIARKFAGNLEDLLLDYSLSSEISDPKAA